MIDIDWIVMGTEDTHNLCIQKAGFLGSLGGKYKYSTFIFGFNIETVEFVFK